MDKQKTIIRYLTQIVNRLTWNRTRDDRLEGGSYIRLTMSPDAAQSELHDGS